MNGRASVLASILAALAMGCVGTETGNPPFAPSIGGETGVPMGIVPMVSVEQAWIAISEVELVPGARCAEDDEGFLITTDTIALELTGIGGPIEADPVITEGDYCALRFERAPSTADSPAILTGSSLAIDASFGTTPVRVRSTREESLALVADSAFAMTPDDSALLVFLDQSLVFNGISFADAAREADGSILVSDASNADLLDRVDAQLRGALFLYRDSDGDGALSAEERAAGPLATGR